MNKKQKNCLLIGIAVIVLMGIFPPNLHSRTGTRVGGGRGTYTYIAYDFIFDAGVVALSNLITQWVVVSAITGGLIIIFKDKKSKDD